MKVDFLIAGVQKAGTTAVHSFLNEHPKIFLPDLKELHFFDNETDVDWSNPDYSIYHQHFHNRGEMNIVGEATPSYIFWPLGLERICSYNSEMKFIVLLRCPVERAYSHWKMEVARGHETLDFSQAIRQGRQRVTASDVTSNAYPYVIFSYVERGFYAQQIKRLFSKFSRDRILFITTEMLIQNFIGQLDKICKHLGVDNFKLYPKSVFIRPDVPIINMRPMKIDDRLVLRSIFELDIAETARLTNLDLSSWASDQPK